MNRDLWRLRQQSRSLQEQRANARGVWDDEASRYIEQRFLRPQLDADEDLREQLATQLSQSTQCQEELDQASEQGIKAVEASAECHGEIDASVRESQTACSYIQLCRQAEARAQAHINHAHGDRFRERDW